MAITGRGRFPFKSSWVNKTTVLSTGFFWSNNNTQRRTMMNDWFFGSTPLVYFGILKRWNGDGWIKAKLMVNTGSFVAKKLKRWDGSNWKEVDSTGV
jgi:hypothetical protein